MEVSGKRNVLNEKRVHQEGNVPPTMNRHVRIEVNWRLEYTVGDRSDWFNLDTQFRAVE